MQASWCCLAALPVKSGTLQATHYACMIWTNKVTGMAPLNKYMKLSWREIFLQAARKISMADDADGYMRVNRYVTLAWLAIIGFPLYYWIWAYWFPQPYENFYLRLAGVALALPLLLARRFGKTYWFNLYFYFVLTYSLPFFFTFMFFMNGGSQVWSQSLLIAVFVLFHLEPKPAVIASLAGGGAAYAAYVAATGRHDLSSSEILVNIPIILFAILAVTITRIGRHILADEKLRGMASAIGVISHELRTPLRSVDANARGIKRYLPLLTATYQEKYGTSSNAEPGASRVAMLEPALARIQAEVQYMNSAIDLLLTNASDSRRKAQVTQTFLIGDILADALERYPFEDEHQRAVVNVQIRADFRVTGNKDLCMMVLFNLLKNGLRAIAKAGKGTITITADKVHETGHLIVHDTGCGIPARELPCIFRRFYAYPPNAGTGIGLAFCRETLEIWGATIRCRSEEGQYTEFIIHFPAA
jgi:two-component system CAI-1 autoinducer sensor kinase/phosphatase CqsS